MTTKRTIAIMGANSQIARCLTEFYAPQPDVRLVLFSHRPELTRNFLEQRRLTAAVYDGYQQFSDCRFDLLLNCVGAGTPTALQNNYLSWFEILEGYDNLALSQLREKCPQALYVNFSSGAVYGRRKQEPAREKSCNCIEVNNITPSEYYALIRLNAEAKHRAHAALRIVDIRIFSFFCRHTPPDAGYFLSDILRSLRSGTALRTSPAEMMRDYIHPDDLCALIELCSQQGSLNRAFDAYSADPCCKSEILSLFQREFGLHYEYASINDGPNDACDVYYSTHHTAAELGYRPRFTSLAGLRQEMVCALENHIQQK